MKPCKNLASHVSRIEGQLRALKNLLQSEDVDCRQVVQLSLAADRSFKSFKTNVIKAFIDSEILKGFSMSRKKTDNFQEILKLSKS